MVYSGNFECLSAMAKVEILKQFKLECLELGLLLSAMPSKKKKKKRADQYRKQDDYLRRHSTVL